MSEPVVSVVMPVFNGERHLKESIDSILSQLFDDFEFLIIDDGSTDGTLQIIKAYSDPRIKLIVNDTNLGLTRSLNNALEISKGEYIARMDGDDVSLPGRFERQVSFLNSNLEVGVCGSWVETTGDTNEVWQYPAEANTIKCRLLFENVLVHSTVMLRRKTLNDHNLRYDPSFPTSQDYELWVRCTAVCPVTNIDEVLAIHRIHQSQLGKIHGETQQRFAGLVRQRQLVNLGVEHSDEELNLHNLLSTNLYKRDRDTVLKSEQWLTKLAEANRESKYFPEPAFSRVLGERWFSICESSREGLWIWKIFTASALSDASGLNWKAKSNFFLQSARESIRRL